MKKGTAVSKARRAILDAALVLAVSISGTFACHADARPSEAGDEHAIVRTLRMVTVRNRTGKANPGKYFGGDRGALRTGAITLSWKPNAFLGALADEVDFYLPKGTIELEAIEEMDSAVFWRDVRECANGARPVLYVHGYLISFERGSGRAALLQEKLGLAERLLWFSWPSSGGVLGYTVDETNLAWSVPHLGDVLDRLEQIFGKGGFDVVAHSLGARGVVQAMLRRGGGTGQRVNELVLVAPDMDAAIFGQDIEQLRSLTRNVTMYVSSGDAALAVSAEVHGYPRLGQAGPHLQGLEGIEIVDVSGLRRRVASGHVYHLYHDAVIGDLDQLLNQGKRPAQRSGLSQMDGIWRLRNGDD